MNADARAWNTPMRLAEATDALLTYRMRATWRVLLLVFGFATFAPLAIMSGGDLNRLPGPLPAAFAVGFLAFATGSLATVALAMPGARRSIERRTTGDLVVDVEEPVLVRRRTTYGSTALRTLELAPRDVRQVVIERLPGASGGGASGHRYRVAIDLADGRSVHPWWSFARGAAGEAFMRDAAARMDAVMRLGGEVSERDTVRISTFDAAAYARGGVAAASVEAQWADQVDPLNPVHTLAQRALAVTVDTVVCVIGLVGLFWLTRARPDTILFMALPLYGALRLAYHTLYEGASGATLGKRIAKLRVVSVDGGPVGFRRAFKRNLARLLDAVAFYLVALVVAAQPGPKRSQRIGDRWAGTLVVDARRAEATLAAHRARG